MKYWTIIFGLVACLNGCSPQNSSSLDATLLKDPATSDQGKPVAPVDLPYFDWDALADLSARHSRALSVSAGSKQHSDANLLVTLRGQAHSEHPIVQVRWWQFSGPAAVIANPNQLVTQVLLPEVMQPATAVFRFAAVNAIGEVNSAQVAVAIQPVSALVRVTAVGAAEEEAQLNFLVRLSEPAQEPILFNYFTEDGSATAGEDYLGVSGTLTFAPGQTQQRISVSVLPDNASESGEMFYLNLRGEIAGETIELRRLGLIVDRQANRNLLSSVPQQTALDPDREGLPGEDGDARLLLRWEAGGRVRLVVEDPCGNVISGSSPAPSCQGTSSLVQTGTWNGERFEYFENMAWASGAAAGIYTVYLEHVAGQAVEYRLDIYGLEAAWRYHGLMANGERLEITQWLHQGAGNPTGNRITGSIVNATNTAPINAAQVRFYQDDFLILEESVGAHFDLPLSEGRYQMVVTAEGYVEWSREVRVSAAEPLIVQVSLSPTLNLADEVARVVLSWGEVPRDLDSHLLSASGFHLYYSNPNIGSALLDVDDTNGYGPETVTIRSWDDGLYRYYVKDYTNNSNPLSTALANSNAVVQLYLGEDAVKVFEVPQGAGVIWHVFDLDPATGELTAVNQIVGSESEMPPMDTAEL